MTGKVSRLAYGKSSKYIKVKMVQNFKFTLIIVNIVSLLFLLLPYAAFTQSTQPVIIKGPSKKGFQQIEKNNYDKAESIFAKILDKTPFHVAAKYGMALIYSNTHYGNYNFFKAHQYINATWKSFYAQNVKELEYLNNYITSDIIDDQINSIQGKLFNYVKEHNDLVIVNRFLSEFSDPWGVTYRIETDKKGNKYYKDVIQIRNKLEYETAKEINTIRIYEYFITEYPAAWQVTEAKILRNQLAFEEAKSINTIKSFDYFMTRYPEALQVIEAERTRNKLAFERAKETNTIGAFAAFIRRYPDASELLKAKRLRNKLAFEQAKEINTVEVFTTFIGRYPDASELPEAKRLRDQLAYEEAKATNTFGAYYLFVKTYLDAEQTKQAIRIRDSLALKQVEMIHTSYEYEKKFSNFPELEYLQDKVYKKGIWTYRYSNGKKKSEGEYKDNVKVGKWVYWDRSGKELKEVEYKNGRAIIQTLNLIYSDDIYRYNSSCVSPDGKLLATSCERYKYKVRKIYLWDVSSGKLLKTHRWDEGHTDDVNSISFSPDGKLLASGSDDNTVKLWDVSNGKLLKTLRGHSDDVNSVSFHPFGELLASCSDDKTITLWDVSSGELLKTLKEHSIYYVYPVCYSPDGKLLASGSGDKTITLWDVSSGELLKTLKGHYSYVFLVCFSPDGKLLASCSGDKTIKLWDVSSGELLKTLTVSSYINSISFSPDGKVLASSNGELWDVSSGELLMTLPISSSFLNFIPDGKLLVSGNAKTVKLWDVSDVLIYARFIKEIKAETNRSPLFAKKGEFETQTDYEGRKKQAEMFKEQVIEKYRYKYERQIEQIALAKAEKINNLKEKIRRSYKQITLKIDKIYPYDTESRTFDITIAGKTEYIKISPSEAQILKKNLQRVTVKADKQLLIDAETYDIFNIQITHPITGSVYSFGKQRKPLFLDYQPTIIAANIEKGVPKLNADAIIKEPSGNKLLDGNEKGELMVTVKNEGDGTAWNIRITIKGNMPPGLKYEKTQTIPDIAPGKSKSVAFNLYADRTIPTKKNLLFNISFKEAMGLVPKPIKFLFDIQAFKAPKLVFKEALIKEISGNGNNIIENGENIKVTAYIRNEGQGIARDVSAVIKIKDRNILCLTPGKLRQNLGTLTAGQSKPVIFSIVVNNEYKGANELPIEITLSEKYYEYGGTYSLGLEMKKVSLAAKNIKVTGKYDEDIEIGEVSYGSDEIAKSKDLKNNLSNEKIKTEPKKADVDINIPQTNANKPNTIALIIGNEDYSTYQRGLSSENNVTHAVNDATIFKEYVLKTLGIEEKNLFFLTNATAGIMSQKIELVSKLVSKIPGAELIFYYAGHGFPDENSQVPYLIPVDVNATILTSAIKLSEVYQKFGNSGAKRITVFIDACFSGGGREAGLLAARGIKITPKESVLSGNMVVFNASSGEQSALPYKEKQHGMFTYFLLKKLQDTKGNVTYGELDDYIRKNVSIESLRVNMKEQDPKVQTSDDVKDVWGEWEMR